MKTVSAVIMSALVAFACRAGTIQINSLDVEADRAVSVTGAQSNKIESAAAHTNRTDNPHATTLAKAAAAGGFAGTEEIGPLRVNGKMYGDLAGEGASGDGWGAYGYLAGNGASGDEWGAYGRAAGGSASGDGWGAYGYYAGTGASGDGWGAYGCYAGFYSSGDGWGAYGHYAGVYSATTNSHFFGRRAGQNARGSNRLHIDVYEEDLTETHDPTGDMIFGDNGQLNLGRTGPLTNPAPNVLRGVWTYKGAELGTSAADTCPVWQSCGLLPTAGGTQYPTLSQMSIILANSATNLWLVMQHPAPQSHIVLQLQTYGNSVAASTNPVSVAVKTGGYGDLAVGSPTVRTVICDGSEASGRYTNIVYIAPSAAPTCGGAFLRFDLTRPNTMASGNGVTFVIPFWRCATSNEILTKTFAP